ncbi:hypothetical protein [Nocardia sp. NPDC060249]|uniref:hypothetical protein n=1 Tax=Nocardia sp. NPDC060249 TaxID=3347082 RepID=UPI00364BC65D
MVLNDLSKERSYSQACLDWPDSKPRLAIIVAPPPTRDRVPSLRQVERIWGLGIVRPARDTDRDRKVYLSQVHQFGDGVDAPQRWFDSRSSEHLPESGPITTRADAVLADLVGLSSGIATAVKALAPYLDHTADWSSEGLRWRDERDAIALFAKIAGVSPNDFAQLKDWKPPEIGASFIKGMQGDAVQSAFGDVREEIASNLGRVGDLTIRTVVGDPTRQTSSYHLELASVVVPSSARATSGSIDAYYYHAVSATLITLRYVGPGLATLALPGVRQSLTELEDLLRSAIGPDSRRPADFGFVKNPLFVRIHAHEPFTTALSQTSPGAIYPIEQLSTAISSSDPPNYRLDRHLVPTDFARLVRDGWIGAREVDLDTVNAMVAASAETLGCAVLVVDMSPRPRGNGP